MPKEEITKELAVCLEMIGGSITEDTMKILVDRLGRWPEYQVIKAIRRVSEECKGRFVFADIITRIEDGRPSAAEAWATLPWKEEVTACITQEAQEAQGVAWSAYFAGDKISARNAFTDKYTSLVNAARMAGEPVWWVIATGTDTETRKAVVRESFKAGRITAAYAQSLDSEMIYDKHTNRIIEPMKADKLLAQIEGGCDPGQTPLSSKAERIRRNRRCMWRGFIDAAKGGDLNEFASKNLMKWFSEDPELERLGPMPLNDTPRYEPKHETVRMPYREEPVKVGNPVSDFFAGVQV